MKKGKKGIEKFRMIFFPPRILYLNSNKKGDAMRLKKGFSISTTTATMRN